MTAMPDPATSPAPADDLDDALGGPPPEWDQEPEDARPQDTTTANALLWRLRQVHAAQDADERIARAQIAQVEDWLDRRAQRHCRQEDWLRRSLTAYHAHEFDKRGVKSIALPNGTLASRATQPRWVWHDEPAFLAWAQTNLPVVVRQKPPPPPEIDRAAAKALLTIRAGGKRSEWGLTADGERPPGLTVEEAGRNYTVTFDQADEAE